VAKFLHETREKKGRLFILGVGGSAANASHAVNDFRKIAGFEAYAPTDNVAEVTARTNDEGWETVFEAWLKGSRLASTDTLLILSVGGGDLEKNISPNLVKAVQYAKSIGAGVVGIVGRNGGYTARVADAVVIVPTASLDRITPHAEAFQSVIWHLLVSHPLLKKEQTKWESQGNRAVFFDRDGTLTVNPKSVPDVLIADGALSAVVRLKKEGFVVIGVTNQADVGRGLTTAQSVMQSNKFVKDFLYLDAIYTCPHTDADNCKCRKPRPGMLKTAAGEWAIDLNRSYMVGDSWRDTGAGRAAGCKVVWVRNTQTPPGVHALGKTDYIASNLTEAVDWILEDSK
jgi:D-sedoheptulose 7-phosphate isomerase